MLSSEIASFGPIFYPLLAIPAQQNRPFPKYFPLLMNLSGTTSYLAYAMAGVPLGAYDVGRLANLGTNHWSVDAGGGFTYLDQSKGNELSIVGGLTYNFENEDTQYRNGIDGHIDWAATKFLSERVHVGLAGYFFYQLTGDRGSGATLGDFESRVSAIGPQVGYFFPFGEGLAYLNFRGYREFDAKNRAEGWNMWLTVALPFDVGRRASR
jgi:hypothetical protein